MGDDQVIAMLCHERAQTGLGAEIGRRSHLFFKGDVKAGVRLRNGNGRTAAGCVHLPAKSMKGAQVRAVEVGDMGPGGGGEQDGRHGRTSRNRMYLL